MNWHKHRLLRGLSSTGVDVLALINTTIARASRTENNSRIWQVRTLNTQTRVTDRAPDHKEELERPGDNHTRRPRLRAQADSSSQSQVGSTCNGKEEHKSTVTIDSGSVVLGKENTDTNADSGTPTTPTSTFTDTRASTHLFASASHLSAEESAALSRSPHPLVAQALQAAIDTDVDAPTRTALLRARLETARFRPLREAHIRSADEKLRARPPEVALLGSGLGGGGLKLDDDVNSDGLSKLQNDTSYTTNREEGDEKNFDPEKKSESSYATYTPDWQRRAQEPLLPAVEGHRPWHTTFVAPTHATARVKLGVFSHAKRSSSPTSSLNSGLGTAMEEPPAVRLGRARESMIDYKLGIRGGSGSQGAPRRPMPVGMKGWANLVEERIEVVIGNFLVKTSVDRYEYSVPASKVSLKRSKDEDGRLHETLLRATRLLDEKSF